MGKTSTGDGAACQDGSPKAQRLSQAGEIVFVLVFVFVLTGPGHLERAAS